MASRRKERETLVASRRKEREDLERALHEAGLAYRGFERVQLTLDLESGAVKPEPDLAERIRTMCAPCRECGRRGYHLVTCSIGRSPT